MSRSQVYTLYTLSGSDVPYRASSQVQGVRDISFSACWSDGGGLHDVVRTIPAYPDIQDRAERDRVKCQQIYGGVWIVEYHIGEDGAYHEPNPQPQAGSVRTREKALLQADRGILAGPDTPGKRFLLGRCSGPLTDALPIASAISAPPEDDLPF